MKVLLNWLADFAWVLYAACGLLALFYIIRALTLQGRLSSSLTSFERETTATRASRTWRAAVVFILLGLILVAAQFYILPQFSLGELETPTPTQVGFVTFTPVPTSTATPIQGSLPTVTSTVASPPAVPTVDATVAAPPTPSPTVAPTPTAGGPEVSPAITVGVRLGNVAELVGFDISTVEVSTGDTLGLTLYWRALDQASAADYWVFTHLLSPEPDLLLIAQDDGVPAGGERPTTGWTPGEIIVDYHLMTFREPNYIGDARIQVGLYDSVTQDRVPVEGGGTAIELPISITVTGP